MKCVYKIVCRDKDITEFYIGSSVDFNRRKSEHESHSNNLNCNAYCYPVYMFINVNGGFDNWKFEVIKEYKFITKKELTINEQYYKDLLKPELNSYNAYGRDIARKKNTQKIINNIKANCPHCNLEMLRKNINSHKKTKKCMSYKLEIKI